MVDMNGQDGDSFQFLWGWGLRAGRCPSSHLPRILRYPFLFSLPGQRLHAISQSSL